MGGFLDHAARAAHAVRDHLGEAVTFEATASNPGAAPRTVTAFFDDAAEVVRVTDGVEGVVTAPQLLLAVADFPTPPKVGDRITARGVVYELWTVERDGVGASWECRLQRTA